jgi:translocation and assembly module TamA
MDSIIRTPLFGLTGKASLASLLLLFALMIISNHSAALDLPFLGPNKDFEIRLKGHERLKDAIVNELMQQKKNNPVLKRYSSQYKIDRHHADTIRSILRSEGYYDAEVSHQRQNDTTIYTVEPGPRYKVTEIHVDFPEDIPAPSKEVLPLRTGQPLRAEDVLAGREAIRDWTQINLCLYRVDIDYDAKVFHQNQTASVTYSLRPTQQVNFGELSVTGLETIEPGYLEARLPIEEGDCFSRRRVDQARLRLLQTNLVANVVADIGKPKDGEVPVNFIITERGHRSISAGVGYDVDLGAGVTLGWEHRNLLGRAEKLEISSRVNEVGYSVESEFTVPHFRRPDQSLVLHADFLRETPDAYETTAGSLGAALTRQVNRQVFGSLGVNLRFSQVLEDNIENDFQLVSLPFTIEYDKRDDLLNPLSGWRVGVGLEPFTDLLTSDRQFTKTRITATVFHTKDQWPGSPTFAGRVSTGTITGIKRRRVPADLRFYVGGGGSVRGYPYQSLGDISDGEPNGGRSFTELALETRLRVTGNWGVVLFLDGGYAYREELPEFGQDLLWGTGLGIRYLTSFAPIRFDVAVPLDRREEIDDPFQIYISIGQAF